MRDAAGNELALELIRLFWDVYRQTEPLIGSPPGPGALVAKHHAIVAAISSGDHDEIGRAVSRHFDEIRERPGA